MVEIINSENTIDLNRLYELLANILLEAEADTDTDKSS